MEHIQKDIFSLDHNNSLGRVVSSATKGSVPAGGAGHRAAHMGRRPDTREPFTGRGGNVSRGGTSAKGAEEKLPCPVFPVAVRETVKGKGQASVGGSADF